MEHSNFEYKKLLELKKISIQELSAYYRKLRSYEYDINKPLETSRIKKKIYFLTRLILKIDRLLSGRKLILFDDKRSDNVSGGKVYASSHVGRYDIESAMEAINEQVYFVMGDPEETYRNFEGFFLDKMSGRIAFDTGYQVQEIRRRLKNGDSVSKEELALYYSYKNDRHIAELNCTKRVAMGDSIFINPEGAWNITDRITQPIYDGAARIAISGKGVINPIGVIRDRKTYKVNIGSEMDVTGAQISDVKDGTPLRQIWADTIEEYFKNNKPKWYKIPDNVVGTLVDPITGKTTTDSNKATMFYYIKGTEPNYDENLESLIPTIKEEKENDQ